jgi:PadR family transcriptional regulator, regulatory protein PadR
MSRPDPLIKGTLDLLVLKALSWAPMHGFEIGRWFETHASRALAVEGSAIYQSLYRMEARRLVSAKWAATTEGRRARYYSMTAEGRKQLHAASESWARYAAAVTALLAVSRP